MKKATLLLVITLTCLMTSYAQESQKEEASYFIVLYTIGEKWDTTKVAHEQEYFAEHSIHLGELRKTNKVAMGARYSDTGMLIIRAGTEKEAKALITEDHAIQNNVFKAEIFPFDPFYKGCIE